ncbi:MAG TPA: zinc-binding dehydrogenase [Ignavibacteriaceae bacterium]|nr:zinc-binding dehydrogenase [Ignavibacteriaceae bacterium]
MKAAVTEKAGPPSVMKIKDIPKPEAEEGKVLINVKAFALNRAEVVTRQGYSPTVKFPRVIGIECVGIVEECLSGKFKKGEKVAAMVGGMGRKFDGSYAEYTLVPESNVFSFHTNLSWEKVGAIPEMYLTMSGALLLALQIKKGDKLLIRGGSSSIGLNACRLAKYHGLTVISTTRNENKKSFMLEKGADEVIIDDGNIHSKLRDIYRGGVEKVLEFVGTKTLVDSLKCIDAYGVLCMIGGLGMEWSLKEFSPMGAIPNLGRLTMYGSDPSRMSRDDLQRYIDDIENNRIELITDKVFILDDIVEAHKYMESNEARGRIVVVVE